MGGVLRHEWSRSRDNTCTNGVRLTYIDYLDNQSTLYPQSSYPCRPIPWLSLHMHDCEDFDSFTFSPVDDAVGEAGKSARMDITLYFRIHLGTMADSVESIFQNIGMKKGTFFFSVERHAVGRRTLSRLGLESSLNPRGRPRGFKRK